MSDKLQAEIIEDRITEVINLPERGHIKDRNGNILAMSLITYNIALNPNLIVSEKHQNKVSKLLSETLEDISYDDVFNVAKGNSKYKVIAKQITPDKAKIIRESGIGGIQISQFPKRLYPNDELGSAFLGFVNHNGDPGAGLELELNNFLSGTQGYTLAEKTPFGEVIPIGSKNTVAPINGQNVITTIDGYMQHILEKRVSQAVEEMEPQEIHAVIMEPNTGEILAMTSYPSFDSNNYKEFHPDTWTNTPANFNYEPGSIFKPIYMAAAFEYGVIDGTETYPSGKYNVYGKVVRDWNNGRGWGQITAKEIIQHSSNVGMIKISEKMTNSQIIEFLKKHGFDKKTNIELPAEEKGVNFPTETSLEKDPIRRANISFGQGISITPLQLIKSFSEIINGGYKIQPSLVKKVIDNNGNIIFKPTENSGERIYTENTSKLIKEYLKNNMEVGSGVTAQIDGFDAGGKTGSAWFVEGDKYAEGKIIGSFIGFLPYENPKYSVVISVKAPNGVEFGSEAANPIFKDVMTEIVRYEGLTPTSINETDKDKETLTYNFDDYSWHLFEEVKKDLKINKDVIVVKEGQGEVVIDQFYTYKNNKIYLHLITKPLKDNENYYIPSFYAMKGEKVKELLDKYHISYRYYGNNRVVEQNIEPGLHFKLDNFMIWLN